MGKNHGKTAKYYHLLGDAFEEHNKLDLAIKYIKKSLEIRRKLMPSDQQTINTNINLYQFLYKKEEFFESVNEFLNVVQVLNKDDALMESKKVHLKQFLYTFTMDKTFLNDIKIGQIGKILALNEKYLQPLLLSCDSKIKSQYYFFMIDALMMIDEKSLASEYMRKSEIELAILHQE